VRIGFRMPDELPKADAVVIAPATFNTINKWAAGSPTRSRSICISAAVTFGNADVPCKPGQAGSCHNAVSGGTTGAYRC